MFWHGELYPHRSLMRLEVHACLRPVKRAYIRKFAVLVCRLYSTTFENPAILLGYFDFENHRKFILRSTFLQGVFS